MMSREKRLRERKSYHLERRERPFDFTMVTFTQVSLPRCGIIEPLIEDRQFEDAARR